MTDTDEIPTVDDLAANEKRLHATMTAGSARTEAGQKRGAK